VPAYGLPSSYCSVQAAPSEIPTVQFEPKFSPQFLNFFFRPCCCWSGLSLSLSRMPSRASRLLFPCPLWTTQPQQNHLRKWNHHAVLSLSFGWLLMISSLRKHQILAHDFSYHARSFIRERVRWYGRVKYCHCYYTTRISKREMRKGRAAKNHQGQ
jgi:hypothetical protein